MDQTKSVKTVRDESAVRQLQLITIAWMVVEFGISVYTGIRSHSVALTAFGADSAIELISAVVVFRRFRLGAGTERRTARISGALLYVLAAYILLTSGFSLVSKQIQPEPTVVGIGLLVAAGMIMPLLGRAKKKLAMETGSKALNADAAQSNICAYMSWIVLQLLFSSALGRLFGGSRFTPDCLKGGGRSAQRGDLRRLLRRIIRLKLCAAQAQ
jgi:divalent metal cation (Fe/Co/Zn/Cd) transporter